MSRSVQARSVLHSPVVLSARPARRGLLGAACSARPARRGLLGAASLFLMAICLSLLFVSAVSADSSYPGSGGSSGGNGGYPSSGGGSLPGDNYPGGGSWQAVHCDSLGKDIPDDNSSGPYRLKGMQTVTNINTYPQDNFGASYALGNYTNQTMPAMEGSSQGQFDYGIGYDGYFEKMNASNCISNGYSWLGTYSYTDSSGHLVTAGPWNGKVQRDVTGQILTYFQWRYLNNYVHTPMTPPAGSLPPDHMNILLQTGLMAYISLVNGGYAEAWATDGPEFQDKAAPNNTINASHVVRATLNANQVAEVYLNGQVHMRTENYVPFNPNGEVQAYAWAFVSASAAQDSKNREVYITCPAIETSYYKGAVDAQHLTGQWPHIRNVYGSISGDSVVLGTIAGHWKNGSGNGNSFTANTPGFTNPYYLWSKTGPGTPDVQTASSLGINEQFLATIPMNLDFGTEPSVTSDPNTVVAKNPFPLSITVRTDVTDGPNTDGATAANTYAVTYHLPFENPIKYGPEIPDDTFEMETPYLAVGTFTTEFIPTKVEAVDLADGAHIAGGVATAISAGLPLVKVVAQIAEPELVVAQTVFAVFGYALGLAPDAKPETDQVAIAANYKEFCADVRHQVLINQQPPGKKDMERFSPPGKAEIIAAQLQQNTDNWMQDPYFHVDPLKAALRVSAKIYRTAKKQDVQGDWYGVNGYLGPKLHHVRAESDFYSVTHWEYTGP